RDGLQMECVHCTQCIDACDAVMSKIGKPRGLIRYASRDALEGRPSGRLRARVVVYPVALAVALGGLVTGVVGRPNAEVTVLRDAGAPYLMQQDGRVADPLRIRIANHGTRRERYRITLDPAPEGAGDLELIAPVNPVDVDPGRVGTAPLFVVATPTGFVNG